MKDEKKRSMQEWAMHYRQIIILLSCCFMALGIVGLRNMNKNEFPEFTVRQGVVTAVYPGATTEEIEEQVTKPLENYIFSYKEVKKEKTKSYTRDGLAIVQVELNDNLNNKDEFWSKFKHGIEKFKSQLPRGVMQLNVNDDFGDTSALLIAMESKDKTYHELDNYMDALKDSLRLIPSVGKLNVFGMQKEQISIYLDNDRLSKYGISERTIAANLLRKGMVSTAGHIKTDDAEYPIYLNRSISEINDVEQTIIYSDEKGNNIRLKDVARVVREYPRPTSFITYNGKKCLILSIEMKKGQDISKMGAAINKTLESMKSYLPTEVKLNKITDLSKVVSDSIYSFLHELLIAIFSVILVVILLMPIRVALVAASTIPITIFSSLGMFYVMGIELNTVTLAALIVTLGMIVDDSIVIIDMYLELLAEGKSHWHASILSAQHFFKSIFSATLSISITFFPFLIFMTGSTHDFLLSFPWSMAIILFISMFVAQLIVPILQFFFIKKPIKSEMPTDGKPKFSILGWVQSQYDKLFGQCFKHPYITLSAGVGSVLLGVFIMKHIPTQLMPAAERNQFAVEIYTPTGTSLKRTAEIADSLEHLMRKDKRIVSIASFKGTSSPRFHTAYAPQFGGTNYTQFIVNTLDKDATEELVKDCTAKYTTRFPEAYVRIKQLAYGDETNPVEIRITSNNLDDLNRMKDSLLTRMRNMPELLLVRSDFNEPMPATRIQVDDDKASRVGITNTDVEQSLMIRYGDGLDVSTAWEGDYDVNVVLKSNHSDHACISNVMDEMIPANMGLANVPLHQIAKVVPSWQHGQIPHRNGLRTITIMAEVDNGYNIMDVSKKVIKRLSTLEMPSGVKMSIGGKYEGDTDKTPSIAASLITSIVIIFFILLWHSKRIGLSLLILVCLSLCLLGTAIGVLVTGVNFGMTCVLGVVSLMGILVRNGIILFDYAEEIRESEHLSVHDAIFISAKRRMRPIFLTSAAASMGVVPMILSRSSLWMPMGAVICYGSLITMIFILTVMPVAYWLVMKGNDKAREKNLKLEQN